jgi:hypothetical protein
MGRLEEEAEGRAREVGVAIETTVGDRVSRQQFSYENNVETYNAFFARWQGVRRMRGSGGAMWFC